jgi:hypothetical protein
MKESISIKNFGGLKDVTIPLNSINIFIGKQASGKSVTAKLIYFFKKSFGDIFNGIRDGKNKTQIDKSLVEKFEEYFPSDCWLNEDFYIEYKVGDENISVKKESNKKPKIVYTSKIKNLFSISRKIVNPKPETQLLNTWGRVNFIEDKYFEHLSKEFGQSLANQQIFIPAGRSFFANLQSSIFSFLSTNKSIDPFLVEFGSFYEQTKFLFEGNMYQLIKNVPHDYIEDLIFEILGARYKREKSKDYLIHADKRKIDVSFSSSGQQETLPLVNILNAFTHITFGKYGTTIYIEEPEAHLFPSAQKKIIELISTVRHFSGQQFQSVITTHSPYILTSFNNLLEAGRLLEKGVDKKKLFKIVPEPEILKCGELNAYAFEDGGVKSLIDEETGLISAEMLDQVSEEIAVQFDELLDL